MNALASGLGGLTGVRAALTLGQARRLVQLETVLPAGTLVAERCTVREAVHAAQPFAAEVDCLATDAHLSLKDLMHTAVSLRVVLPDGRWRHWHGLVAAAAQLGSDGGLGRYRLSLRASIHGASLRRDARIFQDLHTADIVTQVLTAWPQVRLRLDVAAPGALRALTTQHRESDWAFAMRLMAEEGWSWRLVHAQQASPSGQADGHVGHTLVVFDEQASRPDLGGLRFSQPGQHGGSLWSAVTGLSEDTLTAWSTAQAIGPNAVTLAAWDERQVAGVAASQTASDRPAAVPSLEHYRGHGERLHAEGRVDADQVASTALAEARSRAWLDAQRLRQHHVHGRGAVRALEPGATFELLEHAAYSLGSDRRFSVLQVVHEAANNLGAQAAGILAATDIEQGSYRNRFDAAPAHWPLRPMPPTKPQAPGPQSAVVMTQDDEPVHSDRDGRIRVQFGWQRGERPLAGGLNAPSTPTGADTGHAPGDARSGTWVRVAHSLAGPGWGAMFTPRPGTEVLVDFIDGDIDRPLVIGQLHNGAQSLPWPAGEGTDANHAGTVSGWHHPHLDADGAGANQWVIDDAPGQLRMRLASHSSQTGHNELSLGHLVQHSVQGGPGQARRGQWLGEGFYGHTEGWAVLRAAEGLLLSTTARPAQGASVRGTQMDAAEAVDQLKAARQLGEALGQSAHQQGAHGLHSHEAGQAWAHHADTIDPQAQGRYQGQVNGQDARTAQPGSREATQAVSRFAKPLLHLDTPASAMWVTPASLSLFSGQDHSVAAQGDAHLTAAHTLSSVSGQTTSLYTHAGGIKAITANAALSLRAHTDAQQIWSQQDLTVQSTTDEVRIQASESITLTAGHSQIVIEGVNVTFICPGTWTVKAASHDWAGGASGDVSIQPLPDSREKIFDEQIRAVSMRSGQPIAGKSYRAKRPDGTILNGKTDAEGRTARIASATPERIDVTWLADDLADEFPDVPVDEGC